MWATLLQPLLVWTTFHELNCLRDHSMPLITFLMELWIGPYPLRAFTTICKSLSMMISLSPRSQANCIPSSTTFASIANAPNGSSIRLLIEPISWPLSFLITTPTLQQPILLKTTPSVLILYQPRLGGVHESIPELGGRGLTWWDCLTFFAYSTVNLTISATVFPLPSCLSLFRLLHKLQPLIANNTQSTARHLSLISHTMSIKSRQGSDKRGSFIFVALQTSAAVLHPHRMWLAVSSLPCTSQLVSTSKPFDFSRNFVGRMFLHALHMKCLILFGQSKSK